MRVTRVIREYVEKEVHAKAEAKRKEVSGDYEDRKEKCMNEIDEFMTEVHRTVVFPQVSMILRKHGMDAITEASFVDYAKCLRRTVPVQNKEEHEQIWKVRNELRNKENEVVQDLLINLELGANKNELKEMLESIEF